MRKLSVLALIAAVLVTGSVFAAGRLTPVDNATFITGTVTSGGIIAGTGPTTTNNDDSCDIGVAPAATLLLPYFEVDLGVAGAGRTTVFSVTNVSPYAQIAHVVLYTDWSFPVLDFNLFLTGYDVQPINLYDVIVRGIIGSTTGASTSSPNANATTGTTPNIINGGTASGTNPNAGTQPFRVTTLQGNPNFLASRIRQLRPGPSAGSAAACDRHRRSRAALDGPLDGRWYHLRHGIG